MEIKTYYPEAEVPTTTQENIKPFMRTNNTYIEIKLSETEKFDLSVLKRYDGSIIRIHLFDLVK